MADTLQDATEVLRRHWGFDRLRAGQQQVVSEVLKGGDVIAILPTGGGKSICYQVPALLRDGLTIVISPLIALMQDQVAGLAGRNIPATFINSSLSVREIDQRWTDAEFGRYRLLYLAPERLQSDMFIARAARLKVALLAIDEAHCVSEWGHHFRPAYLEIPKAYTLLKQPQVIAVTATATPEVRKDIVEHLRLRSPAAIVHGFDRPNLVWSIYRLENKKGKVKEIVEKVQGSGVVYAATRRHVEEWATWLGQEGFSAEAYHGGMQAAARQVVQERWIKGETRIIVATSAFGMGIDKPDVRFVVHVDLPPTLESYYQEAGRGGRDGKKSYAVLLYRRQDEAIQQGLIDESHPDAKAVQAVYGTSLSLAQIPVGVLPEAAFRIDVPRVTALTGLSPGTVSACIEQLKKQDVWEIVQNQRHLGWIKFKQPAEATRQYAERLENQALRNFVDALLRTVHADAFTDWWEVNIAMVSRRTGVKPDRFLKGMAFLDQLELIEWRSPDDAVWIRLKTPRSKAVQFEDLHVRRNKRRSETKLDAMLRYARSVTCRRHFLLSYFGERSRERCGKCDICLGRHRSVTITPADEPVIREILQQTEMAQPRTSWFADRDLTDHYVDGLVDWMVQEGYLRLSDPLKGSFALTEKAAEMMSQWKPRR